jgi:hypothetical protein
MGGRSHLLFQFAKKVIKHIIIVRHHYCQLHRECYRISFSRGVISVDFDVADQLPVRFFSIRQMLGKDREYNDKVYELKPIV